MTTTLAKNARAQEAQAGCWKTLRSGAFRTSINHNKVRHARDRLNSRSAQAYPLFRRWLSISLGLEQRHGLHAIQHVDPALDLPEHDVFPVQVSDGLSGRRRATTASEMLLLLLLTMWWCVPWWWWSFFGSLEEYCRTCCHTSSIRPKEHDLHSRGP